MENSKIEWTDHTANLCGDAPKSAKDVMGVTQKHYLTDTIKVFQFGKDSPRRKIVGVWDALDKFQRDAFDAKKTDRVFVGSMMDIFEKSRPLVNKDGIATEGETGELRKELFKRISDERYPNLLFLLLTKRPSNINKYIPKEWIEEPRKNVMYGLLL